jgi:hypothetical protein
LSTTPDRPDIEPALHQRKLGLGFIDAAEQPPGQGSFDRLAGSVMNMFDFDHRPNLDRVLLDPLSGGVLSER